MEVHPPTLPYLLGIPHLASRVPSAFADRLRLGEYQLRSHASPGLGVLLDLPVAARVLGKVHRYFCDPTRDPGESGPEGPFRELDREGKPVFLQPLDIEERAEALSAFHVEYHRELTEARRDEDLLFHFQCQAMEAMGHDICLGNLGSPDGRPRGGGFTTCPQEDLIRLSRVLEDHGFSVRTNHPSAGGYDVRYHGKRWYAGLDHLPVAFLGLDENLWLTEPMGIYDPDKGHPVKERLASALGEFAHYLLQDEVRL